MQKHIYTLLFIFVSLISFGQQTQEQLEQQKAKLLEDIRTKELLLQDVRKKEKSVVKLLDIQKEKIGLKEKLIRTTEKQTKLLSDDIYTNQLKINQLKKELIELKEDYAAMILKSYKSRSEQSRAMFLLSSENFSQAYKRLQYMKQYASYRKTQGQEIQQKSEELLVFNDKIGVQKQEKESAYTKQKSDSSSGTYCLE
jgi:septal ring factor EnvC (AmiA/AmiB activator)